MAAQAPTASQTGPAAIPNANPASPPSKRDLKSWWKGFKLPSKHQEVPEVRPGIFGVPLRQSIAYANVAISLIDESGQSYIYGYVPIVVAKCGVFLKEKATGVQGIFRMSGSEKRIKELKTMFDSPDRYGKGLVWEGYTVHDAANVFRRYLNDLPEPVVPLDLYEKFREPLRGATKLAVGDTEGPQFVENFDEKDAIVRYQKLITELPPLNKQLLLYILDLLAVFAAKSDENRMNSQNLAAIFQPGMLSHPNHAMAPDEYRLNQCVIIFLIENQDHFLIGMQGTGTDEQTQKEIEMATAGAISAGSAAAAAVGTPVTPSRKSGLGRSASNASAGADSVRRDGKIRRNRSVSSRNSKHEGSVTPSSPALAVATPTGGLGRSNTVPSKKSPALGGAKSKKYDAEQSSQLGPLTQARPDEGAYQSEKSSLAPAAIGATLAPDPSSPAGRSQERLLDVPQEVPTPSKERTLPNLFQRTATDSSERRPPNKLKKKRIPGSLNPSAQSSTSSLPQHSNVASPGLEGPTPLEHSHLVGEEERLQHHPQGGELSSAPQVSQGPSNNLHPPARTMSPTASTHSSFNEVSDVERSRELSDSHERGRKSRWRLSRQKNDADALGSLEAPKRLGSNEYAGTSGTSLGSGGERPRKSFTGDSSEVAAAEAGQEGGGETRDGSKGPMSWIRNKYREAKDNAESRRNKSPTSDRAVHHSSILSAGKGLDTKGEPQEEEKKQPAPPAVPAAVAEPEPAPQAQPTTAVPVTTAAPVTVDTVTTAATADAPQEPEAPRPE